ncbi:hypothetical protein PoB_000415500 [Plakobranchus ocellatus]|uniref:Uncharacterized protein n=1 Tax=Plakobranchus ocellatus TaxID=259542 RepID=A0AAV3Y4Q3_9GAST|nr:hypothetical protein PoB_000415500 [Plakobranchus ocellatus]
MTLHSEVALDSDPEAQLNWHSIIMLTNTAAHDHLAVNTLKPRATSFLQNLLPVRTVRNGCAGPEYEGHGIAMAAFYAESSDNGDKLPAVQF